MTPERFTECLLALRWSQRGLSAILKCDDRLVRRWAAGQADIPPSVAAWLEVLAQVHEAAPPPQGWKRRARVGDATSPAGHVAAMNDNTRIARLETVAPSTLRVTWAMSPERVDTIDLGAWIETGNAALAGLRHWAVFQRARIAAYGTAVEWDEGGDLAIDAHHLKIIAGRQEP